MRINLECLVRQECVISENNFARTSELLDYIREVHPRTVYALKRTILTSSVVHSALQGNDACADLRGMLAVHTAFLLGHLQPHMLAFIITHVT